MSERALIVYPDGIVETRASITPAELPPGVVTWLALVCSPEDVGDTLAAWGFHRLAVEDIRHASKRSKFERYPTHDFALVPALNATTDDPLDTVGVYMFTRPGLVVTVASHGANAIETAFRRVLDHPLRGGHSADRIAHAIIDAVSDGYEELLHDLERALEGSLAAPPETGDANPMPSARRIESLVDQRGSFFTLRRTLLPFREMVQRFADEEASHANEATLYFRDVLDHVNYMLDEAALLVEDINGHITAIEARLREENTRANARAAQVNDRLNQVMKYMAAMSTLLLPMTIVSGAFGMNFTVIPLSDHPHGFWIANGLMVAAAGTLLTVFRYKKWI